MAAGSDDLILRGYTCLELADVLATLGRPGEAAECARDALVLYERKGDVASAARVRRVFG
jgi:uncharacterized protein HemY